jgi:CheY-like chemotaxis protein
MAKGMDVAVKKDSVTHIYPIIEDKEKLSNVNEINKITTMVVDVAREAEAKKLTAPTAPKSILIVDEKYLTETLKIILQIVGYRVETATNGIQALKKTMDHAFDLVIIEENLPDSSGGEMAQVIRNMNGNTRVILMTRDEYWEEALKGAPADVNDVLLKPFAPEKLLVAVRSILGPKSAAKEIKVKLPLA